MQSKSLFGVVMVAVLPFVGGCGLFGKPTAGGGKGKDFLHRAETPLVIDGDVNKPAWAAAEAAELVLTTDGAPTPPEHKTTVRMLWDDERLYVAFHSLDPHIWSGYQQRDDPLYNQECVELFLCP